jgi:hypothetical protein
MSWEPACRGALIEVYGEEEGTSMVHLLSCLWRLEAEARKSLLEILDDRFWEECGRDLG